MDLITFRINGKEVTRTLDNRSFADKENKKGELVTGRKGYGCYGKLEIDGKKYQVSLNMVQLQS